MAARKSSNATASSTQPDRIRVIYGSEEMLKQQALDELRSTVEAAFGPVDITAFDGKMSGLADVLDELRSYSLLQQYKLVVVDEADVFVTNHRPAMERYAQAPLDHATLVLRSVRWNRGNLDKLIEKVGRLIKCEPLSSDQARAWLLQRTQGTHGVKLDMQAAQLLADQLGSNLMQLDTELAKLAVLAGEGKTVTVDLVAQVVGPSSDEQAWAVKEVVLEALANPGAAPSPGSSGAVIAKIHELVDLAGQPDILVAYFIADLIRQLHLGSKMKSQGIPEAQIAREFKFWGSRQANFIQALRRLKPGMIARLFDRIVALDVRSKTGRGDALRNLECFCAQLGQE